MPARIDSSPDALVKHSRKMATKTKRGNAGLTRRIKAAVETLVHGIDDKRVSKSEAAQAVGLTPRAFRAAMLKPAVLRYFREQVQALRDGEAAANIQTAIEIRDDSKLKESAAGQKVRLAAAAQLMGEQGKGEGARINVAVGVITPGYVFDMSEPDVPPCTIIDHGTLLHSQPESGE